MATSNIDDGITGQGELDVGEGLQLAPVPLKEKLDPSGKTAAFLLRKHLNMGFSPGPDFPGDTIRKAIDKLYKIGFLVDEGGRSVVSTEGKAFLDRNHLIIGTSEPVKQNNVDTTLTQPSDNGRYAVLAPYWLDGLHNSQGVLLAEEINALIKKNRLEGDREAIAKLFKNFLNARRYGLEIVLEEIYLNDPHLKMGLAEPRSLLNGDLVRDKDGAYRPAAGGRAVVLDKGDSLVLKNKSAEGYAAAMELAIAKGWTAIELTGKPAMLADAWLEAKLKGLDVVNYEPNEKDSAKYTARVAQESALKAKEQLLRVTGEVCSTQEPEQVAMRPFVDAEGQNKVAVVTYTVSRISAEDVVYDNPKEAAQAFAGILDVERPSVIRSVARADGEVMSAEIIAVSDSVAGAGSGKVIKSVVGLLDQEFNEAFAEAIAEEKMCEPGVTSGFHTGMIMAIENGQVLQKVGRDPDKVIRHDVANLSRVPKKGEVVDVQYVNGHGLLPEIELEMEGGGPGLAR